MDENKNSAFILTIGLEPLVLSFISPIFSNQKIIPYSGEQVLKFLENPLTSEPMVCLIGPDCPTPPPLELAQILKMLWPDQTIYYISEMRREFDHGHFIKNGFKDTFSLALDTLVLKSSLELLLAEAGQQKTFKPVKLVDIQPDTNLDFDTFVYLPTNDKHVMFSRSSETMKTEQVERLKSNSINSLFVPAKQMPKFYKYTVNVLKSLGSPSKLSETERQARLQEVVRVLLTGIVGVAEKEGTFNAGKELMVVCHKIVEGYVLASTTQSIYKRIQSLTGYASPDHYSHSSNVSTYASLFSLGLGLGLPEHLATAGLMHDIGFAAVPLAIQEKNESERTPEETMIYQGHVAASIDMIKAQKLILPPLVLKAIQQHHEKYNGTGYPKGLAGSKICIEAQILSIADQFDELTSLEAGKARLSPRQAIEHFKAETAQDLTTLWYEPKLMNRILGLMN